MDGDESLDCRIKKNYSSGLSKENSPGLYNHLTIRNGGGGGIRFLCEIVRN